MKDLTAPVAVRRRFLAWTLLVVALLAGFAVVVLPRVHIETDILALLPADRGDPAVDRALARFTDQLGNRVVFLVGSTDFSRARAGARALAERLQASKAFAHVRWTVDAGWLAQARGVYGPYRDGLLSNQARSWLTQGDSAALLAHARQALYTPAVLARRSSPASDPLDLFGGFLVQTTPAVAADVDLRDGVLTVARGPTHYVLVDARLLGNAFSSGEGDRVAPAIAAALAQAHAAGLQVIASGVVLHAIAAANEARSQVLRFGIVQALGLLLLLWWAFRTWRVPLLAVVTLGVAFLAAFVAVDLAFGRIHVLTLVFGCNLAGVAIDYCMYFCADQFRAPGRWRPVDALASVGGAITVGMVVSVLSYAVLATTPFPGLQQMALFCGAGLIVAWACVLCWYPQGLRPAPERVAGRHALRFERLDGRVSAALGSAPHGLWWIVVIAVVALTGLGLQRLHFQDDIRVLQDAPPRLVQQDQEVAQLLGGGMDRRFLLVRGADPEQVLERSEALDTRLRALRRAGAIGGFMSVTQALPSERRQADNRRLLAAEVYDGEQGLMARFMRSLGFDASAVRERLAQFNPKAAPLTLAEWLPTVAAEPYRHLWLGSIGADTSAAITTLQDVHNAAALPGAAAGLPGVRLLDPVHSVSHVLGVYRVRALWLTALAGLLSAVLLAVYFRRRKDWDLAVVPALSLAVTLALFGWFGLPVNLFNVVALLLVLGLAVDYALFTQRGRAHGYSMLLPVSLAAATTLLAFGLLALSSTPFVRSLGLTVLVGVLVSWSACLVVGKRGSARR
ncbi:MAG TPA: MMPL family transporter [Nevskiaceae bacterium]